MANHEIQYPNEFTSEVEKYKTTDKVHADVYNKVINILLNNEIFLKSFIDELSKKAAKHIDDETQHVTDTEKQSWNNKAENTIATKESNGLLPAVLFEKLEGVKSGAQPNQNAFTNVKAGEVTVVANGETSTFELVPGTNITISADNGTKKIIINAPESIKNPNALAIQVNGETIISYDGGAPKTANITKEKLGLGDVPQPSTIVGSVPTTNGYVGSSPDYARADHSHRLQTSIQASQVSGGTFAQGMFATNATDYTTSRIRNIRFGTTVPTSLNNGELYGVYE